MDTNIGDIIYVTVDDCKYKTIIDEDGVQRFLLDPTNLLWKRWSGDNEKRIGQGTEDLNTLSIAYQRGQFDQKTYMEFNMSLGYSVYGFSELSAFENLKLINPLWDQDENYIGDDTYLYANLLNKTFTLEEVLQKIMIRDSSTYEETQAYFVESFLA